HDYFAEELYQAADGELQEALCRLSLAPLVTQELVRFLFGTAASSLLSAGIEVGFLTRASRDKYDLHPLLQKFLQSKLSERSEAMIAGLATTLGEFLISHELWDELFLLVE